jgi:hypothetical protein
MKIIRPVSVELWKFHEFVFTFQDSIVLESVNNFPIFISLSSFKLCHISLFNTYETPIKTNLIQPPPVMAHSPPQPWQSVPVSGSPFEKFRGNHGSLLHCAELRNQWPCPSPSRYTDEAAFARAVSRKSHPRSPLISQRPVRIKICAPVPQPPYR